ncbi:hypothetical protein [Legionella clemsonensis]|uniref:Transmembrane protein n=1 Tax=Legionella clemsonensis TaxID=1867846 RepID=A0A222P2U9_9GAMM|nr:hypothetical protein [Legionella clemsonensis]ASQ46166.1 hypothetical protein clem_08070 [Legionella clemsonensis]
MSSKLIDLTGNNYSFILKCMAALATGAILTLGIVAAFTMKATAVAAPILFSAAATGVAGAVTVAAAPILPIAALLITLGGICLLPFCFGGSCTNSRHTHTHWGTPFHFYPRAFPAGAYVENHHHSHSGPPHHGHFSSNHHRHL